MGIEHLEPAERSRGEIVQERKQKLLSLLTDAEKTTKKVTKTSGRAYPWTFEDSARQIVSDRVEGRCEEVGRALIAYQSAVNEFWLHLYKTQVPEYVVSQWCKKYRSWAKVVDKPELEAEVIFMLRDVIRRWDPTQGVPFRLYACRVLFDDLIEWVRQHLSDVERPRSEKRKKFLPMDYTLEAVEPSTDTEGDSTDA